MPLTLVCSDVLLQQQQQQGSLLLLLSYPLVELLQLLAVMEDECPRLFLRSSLNCLVLRGCH